MSKFLIKFKRFTYLSLGIVVVLLSAWLSAYIGFTPSSVGGHRNIFIEIGFTLLMLILVLVVIFLIEMMLTSDKKHSFLSGVMSFFINKHNKYVYHENLGYFLASFEGEKVYIYDQGFLYLKKIFDVYNDGDPECVANCIKSSLDSIYFEKLKKKREQDEIKSKIDSMKKWDGYLDKRGRRDGKLNEILK